MIPYFLLLLIPLFKQILMKATNNYTCIENGEKKVIYLNGVLSSFFICFLLLLSLRYEYLGRDLGFYKYIFNEWGGCSLKEVFSSSRECLFHFYCWFVYNFISENFQIYIAVTAIVTILPIASVYCKDQSHGYMKAAIFVNMSTFVMMFSGIRQGMALAAGILAYQAVKDKKYSRFFVFVIMAMFIHHTGFMTLFLWPLCNFRFRKRDLYWIIPIVIVVFFLRVPVFNYLSTILVSANGKYEATATNTGAFMSLLLFALFSAFCYLITDEECIDDETLGLRNILMFATLLQIFASVNSLAMRMNYYFILLIPMAIGRCLNCVNPKYEQLAKAGEILISIFFTCYFFYEVFVSSVTGISALDTYPYVPFWAGIGQ